MKNALVTGIEQALWLLAAIVMVACVRKLGEVSWDAAALIVLAGHMGMLASVVARRR